MAVEQLADPMAVREAWISERMIEFASDPQARDRAIAIILYDSLMLHEQFQTMSDLVRKEGLGGVLKSMLGGKK